MAIEIRDFTVTIPAGSAIAAGFTASLAIPPRVVTEIHVRVPPGPRGEVGFAIGSGGVQIVPYGAGTWIVTDDEDLVFPLDDTITSGAWELLGYNTGAYPHTLRVYFYCQLVTSASTSAGGGLLPPGTISSAGGGATTTPPPATAPPVTAPPAAPPPVAPPPATAPPAVAAPLILPPVIPGPPGAGGGVPAGSPGALLCAVEAAGTVALLVGGGYWQLAVQDDVTALTGAGIAGVQIGSGMDAALRAGAAHDEGGGPGGSGAGSE